MLKKLLSIVLSVVLVLSGVCIGSPGSYAADEEFPVRSPQATYLSYGTDQYTRNDDDVVYDFILGDYEALVNEAKAKTDPDEKYAAYAKAEAELLDSAVIIPTATNSGKATTFAGTLNVNRGSFVLPNGNAASNKTESEKISAAVALSNRNFRKALQFAFDKDSYYAVNYGEYYNSGILRNIFTAPELVSLSKQVEADGHVFAAGTTYGQMVQYYLTAAGSHINAEDGQDVICSTADGAVIKHKSGNKLVSLNSDLPYGEKSEDDHVQIEAVVLGIVPSWDLAKPEEIDMLEEAHRKEVRAFKDKYGLEY